jgi:hypothetical protein
MTREAGVWIRLLALLLALVGVAGCSDDDDKPARTPTATVTTTPTFTATAAATATRTAMAAPSATPTTTPASCPLPAPFVCGGEFPLNTTMTTAYGPAWADVIVEPINFLPCFGPYALCYYANCPVGPDGKTSACSCFEWFGPNFVLVNGILNQDVWDQTMAQCSADPASCQQTNGSPACQAVNRGEFYANATRISTFGFYRAGVEPIGSTDCTNMPGPYAGCMTAPCAGPTMSNGDGTVNIGCDCPIYDGPFQIGKKGLTCNTAPNAWSASYNTITPPSNPCNMVSGPCVPDAPQDECGCPLYNSNTMLPPGSGVDCNLVCQQYNDCHKSGSDIELGYTCDATLCTSSQHDLVFDACLGLQNCDLSEIFKAESAAQCSCCASQLCNCEANNATEEKIYALNAAQVAAGEKPQCEINQTLCGTKPPVP